jgi:CO dehydrogenase maturation factor
VIAVSGKGGTGKTTMAALTVKYLMERFKRPILAVDADANANLDQVLGVKAEKTVGSIREYLTENISRMPPGMSKEVWVESLVQQALVEEKGFDLISMGRPEGPGCYCYLNNIFRRYLDILVNNYDFVVMDNEAGMEHLSRRTTRGVDYMFILSDPTVRGVETALRIRDLARELRLDIKEMTLVVSRVTDGLPGQLIELAERGGLRIDGTVPDDPLIRDFDAEGRPLTQLPQESAALRAIMEILEKSVVS